MAPYKNKSKENTKKNKSLSRRNFLELGSLGLGAAAGVNLLGMPSIAQADTAVPAISLHNLKQ